MTPLAGKHFDPSQPAQQCVVVTVVVLVALIAAAPIGLAFAGPFGAWAAVAAAAIVLLGSCLSLYTANLFLSREAAMWRLLMSMGLRMSIPMAACLIVLLSGGPLMTGGFVYFALAFYLVALPVDTLLACSQLGHKPNTSF